MSATEIRPLRVPGALPSALREPAMGAVSGIVAVVVLTFVRRLLGPGLDAAILFYLIAAVAAGWIWERWVGLLTAGVGALFLLTFPLEVPQPIAKAVLLLGGAGFFLQILEQERRSRTRAEAESAKLERERDRLERARQEASVQRRRAEETAAEQRHVLMTLQRATLTAPDPRIPGLSFAVAYAPATADALVGGDFYNVFRLSDTRAAVILGDITGKGAQAAAAGVVVSNMLRAFFVQSASPAEVLEQLNTALAQDAEFPLLATLFAAIVDGAEGTIVYANAGQEPPCLVSPWGGVTLLEATGVAIGALPDSVYEEKRVEVPPGHTLVAFTDGLTEIRLSDETWMDPQRTYARIADLGGQPPAEMVRELIAWARATSPNATLRDDAALLAITFEGARQLAAR